MWCHLGTIGITTASVLQSGVSQDTCRTHKRGKNIGRKLDCFFYNSQAKKARKRYTIEVEIFSVSEE